MKSTQSISDSVDHGKRNTLFLCAGVAVSAALPSTKLFARDQAAINLQEAMQFGDERVNVNISRIDNSTRRAVRIDNQSAETIRLGNLRQYNFTDDGRYYHLDSILKSKKPVLKPYQIRLFIISPHNLT